MMSIRPGRIALPLLVAAALGGLHAATPAGWLKQQSSAFLRSYADTKVDWMPWGDAAFQRASKEGKPIFVEVGAFGNELGRAMARQTFSGGPATDLLNAGFVCVLVDRDERPDIAALLVAYVQRVKQLEGWPLNVWLTPELLPYEGGTYFPPTEEWGKPGFLNIARKAKDEWSNPKICRARAAEERSRLVARLPVAPAVTPADIKVQLDDGASSWLAVADPQHGGFGDPPLYPDPELLRFLLERPGADRDAALKTLRAIAGSATRDPLDGGFFHSAGDKAWDVPTLQKSLADQARLALAYLDAAAVVNDPEFASVARGSLDYSLRVLGRPDGTFASMVDGTGDKYFDHYTWSKAQVDAALGPAAAEFEKTHGVAEAGNIPADFDPNGQWKGKNLLRSSFPEDPQDAAAEATLLSIRDKRAALPRDDRATLETEGLLITALARAGEQLNEPGYIKAAAHALEGLRRQFGLESEKGLRHQQGSEIPASPSDYAAVALGCRELARAAHRPDLDSVATRLLQTADSRYLDAKAGRYFAVATPLPAGLCARPFAISDGCSPEALALLAGDSPARDSLVSALIAFAKNSTSAPSGSLLLAVSRANGR